ncbi:MAG: HAMP domain-containing protein, partial [Bifidobacterium sp.]|nr:HAMP domain-containing protein [Bifidobacterium sp.]
MGSDSGKAAGSGKPRGRSLPRSPLAAIPLSTKLVASMLILLIVGTVGVSVAICQMADDYLMKRTDTQLIRQANLGIRNATLLRQEDLSKNGLGPTDYFLQIRDNDLHIISDDLNPMQVNGVISRPRLPTDGSLGSIPLGQPTTVPAYVRVSKQASPDRDTMKRARASWRVVAMQWKLRNELDDSEISGVLFIGLSMSDQDEAVHDLTAFCMIISVVVVLLGGVISVLLIQSTLVPLKRIEKTAAKIAAGDLSQRIPNFPENTEVGSLAASLNAMLARIEHSFDEQRQTTEKMKQFVSDASHELRTPLAAIHGYA